VVANKANAADCQSRAFVKGVSPVVVFQIGEIVLVKYIFLGGTLCVALLLTALESRAAANWRSLAGRTGAEKK